MSLFISAIIFLLLLRVEQLATNEIINRNIHIKSISSGTSFGECLGYCLRSINITRSPLQLISSKKPHWNEVQYPSVERKYSFTFAQWQDLIALLDLDLIQSLDDRIGCPDCADGGAEWIQVDWSTKTKRITFEYGKLVSGIEELIKRMRLLREKYAITASSSNFSISNGCYVCKYCALYLLSCLLFVCSVKWTYNSY